eukprot:Opistho-2@14463
MLTRATEDDLKKDKIARLSERLGRQSLSETDAFEHASTTQTAVIFHGRERSWTAPTGSPELLGVLQLMPSPTSLSPLSVLSSGLQHAHGTPPSALRFGDRSSVATITCSPGFQLPAVHAPAARSISPTASVASSSLMASRSPSRSPMCRGQSPPAIIPR